MHLSVLTQKASPCLGCRLHKLAKHQQATDKIGVSIQRAIAAFCYPLTSKKPQNVDLPNMFLCTSVEQYQNLTDVC